MNKKIIGGSYYDAFMVSELEADLSDKVNESDEILSAFVHERTHYLQNIVTLFGVYSAVINMDKYLQIRDNAINGNFHSYEVDEEKDFVSARFDCASGDSLNNGEVIQCHKIESIEFGKTYEIYYAEMYPNMEKGFAPEIILKYDGAKEYRFGGDAIKESMAFLFERQIIGRSDYSHRFPYNAVELLYEYIGN